MDRKIKSLIIFALLITIIISFNNIILADDPLVAVMPIEESDLGWSGFNEDDILNGITNDITNKLVKKENIRVVERSRIKEVIKEQNLHLSGRIDNSTASKIGKILGVDKLIVGNLTRLNVKETGGISVGPLSVSKLKANVKIVGRIVDAQSAEIIASFEGVGEKEESNISIDDLKGVSFGSKAFSKSSLGKSIDQATTNFVDSIDVEKITKNTKEFKDGKVLKVMGDKLIINAGSNDSIQKGDIGELIRLVNVEDLDEPVKMPIGKVKVFSVNNENSSIVKIIETEDGENIKEDDIVRFKK